MIRIALVLSKRVFLIYIFFASRRCFVLVDHCRVWHPPMQRPTVFSSLFSITNTTNCYRLSLPLICCWYTIRPGRHPRCRWQKWHRSLPIWFFSHWLKVQHIKKHQLFGGPPWPSGYRLRKFSRRELTHGSRVRIPGPPVEKYRDLYTRIVRVACNGQQYGMVNTYMLTTCL